MKRASLLDKTKLHGRARVASPALCRRRERLLGFRLARLRHNRPMLEHRLLLQLLEPSAAREKQAHHLAVAVAARNRQRRAARAALLVERSVRSEECHRLHVARLACRVQRRLAVIRRPVHLGARLEQEPCAG